MHRLDCIVQRYAWGALGADSAVARLYAASSGAAIDASSPYAEYWFGTHPSGPSRVVSEAGSTALHDWLLARPDALGCAAYSRDSALPYLLKVLSVARALSVQAHPDVALARRLHASRPDLYPDANHKPELAFALTEFHALCAFRSASDMAYWLRKTPELRSLGSGGEASTSQLLEAADAAAIEGSCSASGDGIVGPAQAAFEAALRVWYTDLMTTPQPAVETATRALQARLAGGGVAVAVAAAVPPPLPPTLAGAHMLDADAVARVLLEQYPGDVGVFAAYLLNTLSLNIGSALFLAANEPHAYLKGDCIEIMACSDNVVRAGLTPKHKDVPTLTSMLTYHARGPPRVSTGVVAAVGGGATLEFHAPVPEFMLQRTLVVQGGGEVPLSMPPCAAILLVASGSGAAMTSCGDGGDGAIATVTLRAGDVFLQPMGVDVRVRCEGGEPLLLFRASSASCAP